MSAPTQLAGTAAERGPSAASETAYAALRDGCGIVDRSERGKLALTGSQSLEFLNGQLTNEVASLTDGQGCYAAFLTHKGKMLGDVRVLATATEVLLDTERVALQALFDMIRRFKLGYDVDLHKRTVECGLFKLHGTRARAAIANASTHNPSSAGDASDASGADQSEASVAATEDSWVPTAEHAHVAAAIAGRQVRVIGTEDGADVLLAAADADVVWEALVAAGAHPVDEADAEVLRVERGIPRYGVDMDDTTIPQEAGINERAVSFTKGCYVGQETVARLYYRGKPNRHLRGLRLTEPVPAGAQLVLDERAVGSLTSSVSSEARGPIGLGMVRREVEPGATLEVDGSDAGAEVVTLPF